MRALLLALTILTTALATASPFPTFLQNTTLVLHTRATDLQTFTGALASIAASPITNSGNPERPFSVAGNSFPDFASAGQRSCDVQFQGCQAAANAPGAGKGKKGKVKRQGVTVEACSAQKDQCNKAQQSAKVKDFTTQAQAPAQSSQGATVNIGPDPLFPDFDLICDA